MCKTMMRIRWWTTRPFETGQRVPWFKSRTLLRQESPFQRVQDSLLVFCHTGKRSLESSDRSSRWQRSRTGKGRPSLRESKLGDGKFLSTVLMCSSFMRTILRSNCFCRVKGSSFFLQCQTAFICSGFLRHLRSRSHQTRRQGTSTDKRRAAPSLLPKPTKCAISGTPLYSK